MKKKEEEKVGSNNYGQYRRNIYTKVRQALHQYNLKNMERLGKAQSEINQVKESQDKDNKDWDKTGEVVPEMPDIKLKRPCMKFGSIMSWSLKQRFFYFDSTTERYRYYKDEEEKKDVEPKASLLGMSEYCVEKKEEHKEEGWKEPGEKDLPYRLCMKFEQRNKRPIYYYSNNINEVYGLKNFGLLCKIKKSLPATEAGLLCSRLEEVLSLLYYSHTSFALNTCISLTTIINAKSAKVGEFISIFSQGIHLLNKNREQLMRAWGIGTTTRSKRNKACASLRLKSILKTTLHTKATSEELIIECAKRIAEKYKKHCEIIDDVMDVEIKECAGKKKTGFQANIIYNVNPDIRNIALGAVEIPAANLGFAKFSFPQENLPETDGNLYFDTENSKIILDTSKLPGEENGCLLGDVSSIVLNEIPEGSSPGQMWLRINGRKINKEIGIVKQVNEGAAEKFYLDPGSEFLARSVDSYLNKKNLLEFKIYQVKLNNLDDLMKQLRTPNLAFRVKIRVGDNFWTSTPFVKAAIQRKSVICEFRQTYAIRVDKDKVEKAIISLWVCPVDEQKLPDEFQSLRQEGILGYSIIRLDKELVEQKKVNWIPLNNGVCFEDTTMTKDQAMISMIFRLIPNVPGNYTEVAMSGKNYTVGEMVYYNEPIELKYPATQGEFDLLNRKDIQYDKNRAGTLGSPLRYPMNEEEWKLAKLEDSPFVADPVKLMCLARVQNIVPFMYRLPEDKDHFVAFKYPGNYEELLQNYKPGQIVTELKYNEVKRICILQGIDESRNCFLSLVSNQGDTKSPQNIIQKPLNEVHSISEEGICVFDVNAYYPEIMKQKNIDFDWYMHIGFSDEAVRTDFLGNLKADLRDYWYKEMIRKNGEMLSTEAIKPPVTGELRVFITEAKNLGVQTYKNFIQNSLIRAANFDKLHVKLNFRAPNSVEDVFNSVFVSKTVLEEASKTFRSNSKIIEHSMVDDPSWSTMVKPAGEMVNMGQIVEMPRSNAFLSITVSATYRENDQEQKYVFGSSEIRIMNLIDEQCPTKYHWLLLKNDLDNTLPQIKFWTMFIPSDKEIEGLNPDDPVTNYGLQLLKKAENTMDIVDSYKQPVFLGNLNPNYMRVEQDFITGFNETKGVSPDEQILSKMLFTKFNPKRFIFEEWQYKLMNAYRYLRQQVRANIFANMASYLWDNYLIKLMINVSKAKTMISEGVEQAEKNEAEVAKQLKGAQGTLLKFDRILIWKEAGSWKYSDLVALCKLGIPKELRPPIWSELLGMTSSKEQNYAEDKYQKYLYYVNKSLEQDSIVFQQMEHDVQELTRLNCTRPSDELLLSAERAGVLKVAKAFYIWCLEENAKPVDLEKDPKKKKQASYGYFKGIMFFIQKIWQVFDEFEAFWSVIGFAKSLPYVFEIGDVMTGSLSWSQKKLMIALTTIVETRYKDLYKALMRFGLPIEYYLGDKLTSMLSTIFPTDTLLRFYDIIALEAASNDPIRSMWVVITGCILLLTLNEIYIKAARSAEEIELIINNTGINCLHTQKIIEKIHSLSNDLFASYNPTLEALLFVLVKKSDSAVGAEYAWTKKARELEDKYAKVKELNGKMIEFVKEVKMLGQEESKFNAQPENESIWIKNLVTRFCKYYKENSQKETHDKIYLYCYKTTNYKVTSDILKINYGERTEELKILPDGKIDQMIELLADPSLSLLTLQLDEATECILDLQEYEVDMPITLDKPLTPKIPFGENAIHPKIKPQPFISFVLMITSKTEGQPEQAYKLIKQSLLVESQIIRPTSKSAPSKDVLDSVIVAKDKQKALFKNAGMVSVWMPGLKSMGEEAQMGPEGEKGILNLLFSLIQNEAMAKYVELGSTNPEIERITNKALDIFAGYTNGKFPLKRLIITLIASATITLEEKLSHLYDFYSSIAGNNRFPFILDDINELVQILYELHLIPISPEQIPHIVEQVMSDGGIDRITNAYLLTNEANLAELLFNIHLKNQKVDGIQILRVTERVQEAFAKAFELWGHQQVFAGDPLSFCGKLSNVLGGFKGRPKNKGPYRLAICYKHKGHVYYKVYSYNEQEHLIFEQDPGSIIEKMNALMQSNRNNLSFVGERIKMDKDTFIQRFKKLPLLTEFMRMNISQKANFTKKNVCPFSVEFIIDDKLLGTIEFVPEEEKKGTESPGASPGETPGGPSEEAGQSPGGPESPTKIQSAYPKLKVNKDTFTIQLSAAYSEDVLTEVKGRIFEALRVMTESMLQKNPNAEIPPALDPNKYLNHSLRFVGDKILDDATRIGAIGLAKVTLTNYSVTPGEVLSADRKVFAFHTHGEYSTEWVKCIELRADQGKYEAKTILFPEMVMSIERPYLLLDQKDNMP